MRHRVSHRKLGRVTEHRIAMLRNQAHGAAPARADRDDRAEGEGAAAVRRADHHHRQARRRRRRRRTASRCTRAGWCCATSRTARSSSKLFDTIAPRFEARPGGYTRILRLGYRRGDSAEVAQIELVGSEYDPERRGREDRGRRRRPSRRASAAGCAPRPSGCAARRPKRARKARRRPRRTPSRRAPKREKSRPHRHARQGRQDVDARERPAGAKRRLNALSVNSQAPICQLPRRAVRTGSALGLGVWSLGVFVLDFFRRLLPPLRLRRRDDLAVQVRRHLLVVRELHVVRAAAAGRRREVLLVGQHLGHRHLGADDGRWRRACPCRRCGRGGCSGRPSGRRRSRSARRPRRP